MNKLEILKLDLQILSNDFDEYLSLLIEESEKAIEREGIILEDSVEDGMLVVAYARHLYRDRANGSVYDKAMPRFLRVMLNNRLFSQKRRG